MVSITEALHYRHSFDRASRDYRSLLRDELS